MLELAAMAERSAALGGGRGCGIEERRKIGARSGTSCFAARGSRQDLGLSNRPFEGPVDGRTVCLVDAPSSPSGRRGGRAGRLRYIKAARQSLYRFHPQAYRNL